MLAEPVMSFLSNYWGPIVLASIGALLSFKSRRSYDHTRKPDYRMEYTLKALGVGFLFWSLFVLFIV